MILSYGFKHNNADKCIYSKFNDCYGVIICLYVDDMLIFGTNMEGIFETKNYLTSIFKRKDLKKVDTILSIKVKKHSRGYSLCQSHYVEKMLSVVKLTENSGRAIAQLEYASAIGSLIYAMHNTRPDISFVVYKLSRYTNNPSTEHWKAIDSP